MLRCTLEDIYKYNPSSVVITVGNFDGVHQGHLHLFSILRQQATRHDASSVVITFEPHPKSILQPEKTHYRLTLPEEKQIFIEKMGIDYYIEMSFTPQFAHITYQQFLQRIINLPFTFKVLCLGKDHKFGKAGEGTINKVREFLQPYHVDVMEVEDRIINHQKITSTAIRKLILSGNIEQANHWLSYPYSFQGTVIAGASIGRTIGFPTANIAVNSEKILPPKGVYAVKVTLHNKSWKGMMNIGCRPTLSTEKVTTVEVHIFDFEDDIYGQQLQVFPLQFIRPEKKMDSIDALKKQLEKDLITVKLI